MSLVSAMASTTGTCPHCGTAVIESTQQPSWCPACEWNLESVNPLPGKRRASRRAQRQRLAGFAADRALYERSRGAVPSRPSHTRVERIMIATAAALVLGDLGLLAYGLYLAIAHSLLTVRILGVLLVLVAVECRPRVPRLRTKYDRNADAEAPHLRQLVDAVTTELGAPRIATLLIDERYNASCARAGWRWRPVLTIGLPLWAGLDDDSRLALLGHEVGHLVNDDPTTSLAGAWGVGTLDRLTEIFSPRAVRTFSRGRIVRQGNLNGFEALAAPVTQVLFLLPYLLFSALTGGLWRLAMNDHKAAEVYADGLALRLGGSSGLIGLQTALLFAIEARRAIRSAARVSVDPIAWRAAAAQELAQREPALPRAIQLSLRHGAARYRTHPPAGLRLRLAREWPATPPSTVASPELMRSIDRELHGRYVDLRQTLMHQTI
jgi:heat shock protein HtpX